MGILRLTRRQLVGIAGLFSAVISAAVGSDKLKRASQDTGGILYPQTAAEKSCSAMPENWHIPPGWVTRYGSNADPGTTDMTAPIQAAINQAAQPGAPDCAEVFFPGGIYGISAPLMLPAGVTLRGVRQKLYPNFTTDWQTLIPSWGQTASTIQYIPPAHGPIFIGASNCSFDGLVFRYGGVRATSGILDSLIDANAVPASNISMIGCCFQNLDHVVDSHASYGLWQISHCQFIGMNTVFTGAIVDMQIWGCVFSSMVSCAIYMTPGSGDSQIFGNRFEYNGAPGIAGYGAGCRRCVVVGNHFDAHYTCAIDLNAVDPGWVISDNEFWRSGYYNDGTGYNSSHIHLQSTYGHKIDNTYYATMQDSGGVTTPQYVLALTSCSSPSYFGGLTRNACVTSKVIYDQYGTSANAVSPLHSIAMPAGQTVMYTTTPLLAGATTARLTKPITPGSYRFQFPGGVVGKSIVVESRSVTVAAGGTACSWTGGLAANQTAPTAASAASVYVTTIGTALDDFEAAVSIMNQVAAAPLTVELYENRHVVGSTGNLSSVHLRGIGSTAPTLTNISGATGFLSMDNINYGTLAYTFRRGCQYAPSQPHPSRANGVWRIGDVIYDPAPSPGGAAGWVLVTLGTPDTWKAWGTIASSGVIQVSSMYHRRRARAPELHPNSKDYDRPVSRAVVGEIRIFV